MTAFPSGLQHDVPAGAITLLDPRWSWLADTAARYTQSNNVWPAANRALFLPFMVPSALTARRMLFQAPNASGNVDVGIYESDGALIVSSGSTPHASGLNNIDITDTLLDRGIYYAAIAIDNTTAQVVGSTGPPAVQFRVGGMKQASTSFPLPASPTFEAVASNVFPALAIGLV